MQPILGTLEALYTTNEVAIEAWLVAKRKEAAPFLYNSVDLRHSGARLVPVDTNLYPAGFNNLSAAAEARAGRYMARYFAENMSLTPQSGAALAGGSRGYLPPHFKILIVPEAHTRNLAYLDNLHVLSRIISATGAEVRIGSVAASAGEVLSLTSLSGHPVQEFPLTRRGDVLLAEDGFQPDAVVLNNDCTSGIPEVLKDIAQPIFPPPTLGWHVRRKSEHFRAYQSLVADFCAQFGLDDWLLHASFHACGRIDFKERTGLDCLAKAVDKIISQAKQKHLQYGIADDPYVFIKADSGTYGMGIMTARDGAELLEINKKERNKMAVVKEGAQVSEVIIQEGVPTIDRVHEKPAEPMIYLVDGIPAGGMFRVNGARDSLSNLNATGVEFTGMCDENEAPDARKPVAACHFRAYGLIATMAALAVPRENYSYTKDASDGPSDCYQKQA